MTYALDILSAKIINNFAHITLSVKRIIQDQHAQFAIRMKVFILKTKMIAYNVHLKESYSLN